MITRYRLTLGPVADHPLFPASAYRLYAHLLELLDEEAAFFLHEAAGRTISQSLLPDRETGRTLWTIHLLTEETAGLLSPVLDTLTEVRIENQVFPLLDRSRETVTAEDLILRGRQAEHSCRRLRFQTLTSFRQGGRYVIFPQERLILQSLILRWNEVFPRYPLADEDAFQALLAGLHIVDYSLRSGRFLLKGTRIPGFTGWCLLEAKLALPLLELWNTLLLFGEYAGFGIKTGLGMGALLIEEQK